MSIKIILLLSLILSMFSCTESTRDLKDPQDVLAEYVSRTFSSASISDKQRLLDLTEGEVKKNLESMTEGNFRKYFIESKRNFVSLKVLDKRDISSSERSFTYELTYLDKTHDNETKIINKKICNFKKIDKLWKIVEVKNIKTFMETTKEMNVEGIPNNLP